ncbi:MAG: MAPEG family protein [Bradyrhizobiaceae bacterium]|nr:MAPEG family protein [Bradyrhizobiaceae bacterium]
MSLQAVLAPLFVQVVLTFALLVWLAYQRVTLISSGVVKRTDIALREPNWPARTLQLQNAVSNQFEVPVLFYALTILSIVTRHADLAFVILAWVFVLLRIIHASIHVTDNDVRRRGLTFIAATTVLMVMWILFMLRILLGI